MGMKFSNAWRKEKEEVSLGIAFIPIVLLSVALSIVMIFIIGAIVNVCWNVSMPAMFGFSKITMFQALLLTFTIYCLRYNYLSSAKSAYKDLKEKLFEKSKKEEMTKDVSKLLVIIVSVFVTVWITMYSWNNILPPLLNIELVQINFGQAFGFACMFNLLFKVSKSSTL